MLDGGAASPSTGRGRWSSQNIGTFGQNWSQVGAVPDNWCQLGKLLNFGLQLHPFLAHRPRGRYCAAAQKRRVGIVFNCMLRNYWPLPRDDLTRCEVTASTSTMPMSGQVASPKVNCNRLILHKLTDFHMEYCRKVKRTPL